MATRVAARRQNLYQLFFLFSSNLHRFFSKSFITITFDGHSGLYRRRGPRLPSALQFEQSVKGKKEINSTLTNVNKVLSGQQRRIDSIKPANVPLACLSFNSITGTHLHISALRTANSPPHLRTCMRPCSRVWGHVYTCIMMYVCVAFGVCLWTASLYIY